MKIEVWVMTDKVRSKATRKVTIDPNELEDMDERERENYLAEIAEEEVHNMIDWGWEEVS